MKIFLFDIGRVLVDFDFQVLADQIAADAGRPLEPLTPRDIEMDAAVEKGLISDQEFVDYLNASRGLTWTVDSLISVWQRVFSINEAGRKLFIDSIARGLPVYTLSNIAGLHITAIERNWPGFFDGATGMFLSYQLGAQKPDPAIYRMVLEKLGVEGKQCLFIDDRADNIEAARAAGIHALQFIPETHPGVHEAVAGFFGLA
ncbi:MAG: HAD family phosphatase [Verrucomicrobia bacterium]|nr:HAD family phosphatase [Verrucomicrobiota bacterium]